MRKIAANKNYRLIKVGSVYSALEKGLANALHGRGILKHPRAYLDLDINQKKEMAAVLVAAVQPYIEEAQDTGRTDRSPFDAIQETIQS